jgi:excisionase family DNA binding protein
MSTQPDPGVGELTLHEAADRLGVHYMTVYRWVRTGRLPATRIGAEWRVDPADVEAMRRRPAAAGRDRGSRGRPRSRAAAAQRLRQRLIAGDEAGAWAVLEELMAAGASPTDVYVDVITPALAAVGAGWADGEVSVADEHRASVVVARLLGRMGPHFARPGRKRGTVVIGAPAGEAHSLPGSLLADVLRGAGFAVVDLGANTPAESFVEASRDEPRLVAVLVGAFNAESTEVLRTTVAALHAAGIAPVLVGGSVVSDAEDAARLGADGWTGEDARTALATVEELTRAA